MTTNASTACRTRTSPTTTASSSAITRSICTPQIERLRDVLDQRRAANATSEASIDGERTDPFW